MAACLVRWGTLQADAWDGEKRLGQGECCPPDSPQASRNYRRHHVPGRIGQVHLTTIPLATTLPATIGHAMQSGAAEGDPTV